MTTFPAWGSVSVVTIFPMRVSRVLQKLGLIALIEVELGAYA